MADFADMRPRPVRAPHTSTSDRVDAVHDGRYGIQQYAAIRGVDVWTFTTINCGYERLEDALAAVAAVGDRYRVADRTTGLPIKASDNPSSPASPDGGA